MSVNVASVAPALPDRTDEIRTAVRAAVEQAMAGRDLTILELQRRLDALERRLEARPVVAPAAPAAAAPQPATAAPLAAAPLARVVPYSVPSAPATRGPAIDVAAIERAVSLDPDIRMFDGRRRRVRLVLASAFALCVVFAGLLAALAQSYTHGHP